MRNGTESTRCLPGGRSSSDFDGMPHMPKPVGDGKFRRPS
jgi:hypothetical protein